METKNSLLSSLKKSMESYSIKEDKDLLFKAIKIYHGYLFKNHYRISYEPPRERNTKQG